MSKIEIQSLLLGMVATNCYLIGNKETNEALIIDPADDAVRIAAALDKKGWKPVAILLTHGHFDHIMAVNDLKEHYDIPVYAHEAEEDVLKQTSLNMSGNLGSGFIVEADIYVKDGQQLKLAGRIHNSIRVTFIQYNNNQFMFEIHLWYPTSYRLSMGHISKTLAAANAFYGYGHHDAITRYINIKLMLRFPD